MTKIVRHNPEFLLSGQHKRISIGIEPSGELHLGNAVTIYQGMLVLQRDLDAVLDIRVCDLDYHYRAGTNFLSYFVRPEPKELKCHETLREHVFDEVTEIIGDLSEFLDVDRSRIAVNYMSPITADARFTRMLENLFLAERSHELLRNSILNPPDADPFMLLAPICSSCNYSTNKKLRQEDGARFLAKCKNRECSVSEYTLELGEPGRTNMFYLLTPIRDLLPDEHGRVVDLHIFGGDYVRDSYGPLDLTKAERVAALFNGLSDNSPVLYVGPLYVEPRTGGKLAKSSEDPLINRWGVRRVREYFADKAAINWCEKLKISFDAVPPWTGESPVEK